MLTGNTIADEQKEVCAILVMRTMLEDYCKDTGKNFEQELLKFTRSKTYEALFDFGTRLWAEGPDYLRDTYEAEIKKDKTIALGSQCEHTTLHCSLGLFLCLHSVKM